MKALIQRVKSASVTVDGEIVSSIGPGLLVFLGVAARDSEDVADFILKKVSELRIFEDENGKFNHSLLHVSGEMLVVSQFTLLGDTSRGRRPDFFDAEKPARAEELYKYFLNRARQAGIKTSEGVFGAHMDVALINDGPVTLMIEKAN